MRVVEPLAVFEPDQPLEAVQEIALVDTQVRVVAVPFVREVLLAVKESVGAGRVLTGVVVTGGVVVAGVDAGPP